MVVHSRYGRNVLVQDLGLAPESVHVIHHGAFEHLTRLSDEKPLPPELRDSTGPVVLYFGLIRPYKGVDVLLDAWREISGAELWIAGRPRMDITGLRAGSPASVRWLPRFLADAELPALFRRADMVVLPYTRTERFDQSGVLATALAFGKAILLTDVGGFGEVAGAGAARLVTPGDPGALAGGLRALLDAPAERASLEAAAIAAAAGPYSWDGAAELTLRLYARILAA